MLSISREVPLYREFLILLLKFIPRTHNNSYPFNVIFHWESPSLGACCKEAGGFVRKDCFKQESSKKNQTLYSTAVSGYALTECLTNLLCFHTVFRPNEIQKDLLLSYHCTLYLHIYLPENKHISSPDTAKQCKAPQIISNCQVYLTCLSVRH